MLVIPLSTKEFPVTKLGLTLKYNKYTLEKTRMGRCADKNIPAKAYSQLEIASYWDSINHKAWLTS